MGDSAETEIQEMVTRETGAWDSQDVETLLDLFHPDMVWAWPPTSTAHNPEAWELEFGRFDRERWRDNWQQLFNTHDLIHNNRTTQRITVSEQDDGGMAVVDIDTLWRESETGEEFHWNGRTAKLYALVDGTWKLTAHWGALRYDEDGNPLTTPE
jgi:ketosteroid isomerase-like protein